MTTPITNEQGKPTSPPTPTYYPIHPLANLFPRMTEDEYKRVLDSIRANGQLQPISLFQGHVLDGRHRQDACKELGRDVAFTEFKGTHDDALKFVISQNVERRHLNPSQLGLIAAEIANLKKGANQHTKQDGSIDLSSAAAMLGVSPKSVQRAKNVLDKAAPDVVEKIRSGKVRVGAVTKKVLALPKEQQSKAIETETPEPNASDKYDAAEAKLIEKLTALTLDQAEAAVPATNQKLRAAFAEMTKAAPAKKEAAKAA